MFRTNSFSWQALACVAVGVALGCSAKPAKQAAASLPTYHEGGTLELTLNGLPVSVKIVDAQFANTDPGFPDLIELWGPQTYIQAQVEEKIHDGPDGLSDYSPLLNKPIAISPLEGSDPLTVGIPGVGQYAVTGGTITLTKYDHGMEGRDWWEGDVEVAVNTTNGPGRMPGKFKIGIVPVW